MLLFHPCSKISNALLFCHITYKFSAQLFRPSGPDLCLRTTSFSAVALLSFGQPGLVQFSRYGSIGLFLAL